MVILFLLFIIQFSIACACLAVTSDQQHQLAMEGWKRAKVHIKVKAQTFFHCYGFENQTLPPEDPFGGGVPFQKVINVYKCCYCMIMHYLFIKCLL